MKTDYLANITNFELDEEIRIENLIKYNIIADIQDVLEVLKKISLMYQFSGSKVIENFLFTMCSQKDISPILRIESVNALFNYSEILEEIAIKVDSKEEISFKNENNFRIIERNKQREIRAYNALDNVLNSCKDSKVLSITIKIDSIYQLMQSENHKLQSDKYFRIIISDLGISCDFRYKTILNLEKKSNSIKEYKYFMKNALFDFLQQDINYTMYRILSSQNLLQHFELQNFEKQIIQDITLSFAQDNELDYDLRADSADVLLNLGTEEYASIARDIITMLGRIEGRVKTVYEDKQNVHSNKVEDSVMRIIEFLSVQEILKVNNKEIDYDYVNEEITKILKNEKDSLAIDKNKCNHCEVPFCDIGKNKAYCSDTCDKQYQRHSKIKLSLIRIDIDRVLYLNNNLSKLLVKLWSYIAKHEHKDEILKRLIQELEEMSGTCSSGFVSRLVNCLSGFDELSVGISYEEQLIANFIGRLNAYTRKIDDETSIFYNDKIDDVIELFINTDEKLKNKLIKDITKSKSITDLPRMKELINKYLEKDKIHKIKECLEEFKNNVIYEMTIDNINFSKRQNFLLFFRMYLPTLRQELYEEFVLFMDEFEFDIIIRKAISRYEGLENFI